MICSCYLWRSGGPVGSLSIGSEGSVQNCTGGAGTVERSNLMCASFQLVSTNVCSDRNREDNASGRLKGGEQSQRLPLSLFLSNLQVSSSQIIVLCPFFVSWYLSYRSEVFPWRQVVLSQFWLPRRDSTSSNTGVGFVLFLLLFLCCIVSFDDHWRFSIGYCPLWF
jgi:hypothetical protein